MRDRTLVTLFDQNQNLVEQKVCNKSLTKIRDLLGIERNLDKGDVIVIESEEI